MFLTLLKKEFNINKSSIFNKRNILSYAFSLLISILLIILEIYLFIEVSNRFKTYGGGDLYFFEIFVTFLLIIEIILCSKNVYKTIYNQVDNKIILPRPVRNISIIFSKLFYIYLKEVISILFMIYPIFISYGIISNLNYIYYLLSILFIIIFPLFTTGIGAFLSIFIFYIAKFLKVHNVFQIIIGILFFILICFIYGYILNLVTNLVSNNNNYLLNIFNSENVEKMKLIANYLGPTNYFINFVINPTKELFSFLLVLIISIGVLFIGVFITSIFYSSIRRSDLTFARYFNDSNTLSSPLSALIKKEANIYFRDTNYLLYYLGVLIVVPYLIYLIINAINSLFNVGNMAIISDLLPGIVPIFDIFIIVLFISIINSNVTTLISNEKSMIRINKSIPISYKKQVFAKLVLPIVFSIGSLILTVIVLYATKLTNIYNLLIAFTLSIFLIISNLLFSIYRDLKKPNFLDGNSSNNMVNGVLWSLILPILIFLIDLILIIIYYFNSIDATNLYLICIVIDVCLVFILFIISIILLNSKINKYYQRIEE